jgi:hypothetical protein
MPWRTTQTQRFLTIDFITKKHLCAPAIWLNPQSATPNPADAIKEPTGLGTDLSEWMREEDERNVAIRLVDGFIELRIQAPDEVWLGFLFKAFRALHVDARAAFGSQFITSIILRIDDPETIDRWRALWPRGSKDKSGGWVETTFAYSAMPTPRSKAIWIDSKPLPGSSFAQKLVVWRPWGKPAADDPELGLEDLEPRPLAASTMDILVRAIAFATLAYWLHVYQEGLQDWDETLTRNIGGWIARLILEGQAINTQGKSLEGVCWSPIDNAFTANELVRFLQTLGAAKSLKLAFEHAESALERNLQAPVPGWGAIETMFGVQAKIGIRRAFRAGLDIDVIERMSDQYVLDVSQHVYLDREALLKDTKYDHKHDDLVRVYENHPIFVGPKQKRTNPFRLYAASSLRTDVHGAEFFPGQAPAAILRYSRVHGLLNGEDRYPDEYRVLNTFPGFAIKPIATIDEAVMRPAVTMLDRMLGLLTQENDAQIKWLKKFIAWILHYPQVKQQVCPVIVGGQGIGKSLFGENLMTALFGSMAGFTNGTGLSDDRFLITPFIGKLVTFLDEVRLEAISAINEIKKLVRQDRVSGQVKFGHQKTYYIPSRVIIAANQPNIGLTPEDAADRAFFFIISWTAENKHMTDREFQAWSLTLKPFYAEFVANLEKVIFKQHLMRHFIDIEVTRGELEDLALSSRDDASVVRATMSKSRQVARDIVADARVLSGLDITSWFNGAQLREAIKRVDSSRTKIEVSQVMTEFERAGVIEHVRNDLHKFKYRYGTLIKVMSEAHNLEISPNWDYKPDDWGDNDVASVMGGVEWRGNDQRRRREANRKPYDPDYMEPEP